MVELWHRVGQNALSFFRVVSRHRNLECALFVAEQLLQIGGKVHDGLADISKASKGDLVVHNVCSSIFEPVDALCLLTDVNGLDAVLLNDGFVDHVLFDDIEFASN